MVACLFSSMEGQNKKSYFFGNGNLQSQNHQVQTNIPRHAELFTCSALAHTFRKPAWEAGFEWPFRAEPASLPIIPITQIRDAEHGSQSTCHCPAWCTAARGTCAAPGIGLSPGEGDGLRLARMWVCGWVQLGRASGQAGETVRS